ncbi:unnamed protein product [Hymenolepis diminuta]|uniref:Uncharacterized protein n=2 Tax=Hymenolepis diminuta TaxID=6216 RepID=A0A564YSV7_HYMDI|nr:unnamed protein product [Hymenolepis diminuta]
MAHRNFRQEGNLNERIAAIRENNARLENRHREIELDKKRAAETGSSILPSQIKITICRNDNKPVRNGVYENTNNRNKGRQGYRPRGGGGPLGYNLSKSLSRLPYDANYANSQPQQHQQFQPNRQQGGRGGYGGRGSFYLRGCGGGGNINNNFPPVDYVRHVEIDRFSNRGGGGKPQRYSQNHNNRNFHGLRNGQYRSITPAKSMPSLDPALFIQNSRPFNSGNQGRGGIGGRGNFRPQNLPPRFRHNSYKCGPPGGPNGGPSKMCPPPPPPFPPPSPSQPTPSPSQKWPQTKDRSAPWVRGNTIKSQNPVCRVATVSTKDGEVLKSAPDSDSPFINPDEDDDDGYIDDNPLDDLDQFTLKIDMDGGFIVHDATICDPILSRPISSWIDEAASELNGDGEETEDPASKLNASSNPEENFKSPGKDGFDLDGYIFSNSSLTTSGVSTLSSLDCRLVSSDFHIRPIPRSYSADQLDKASKSHQNDNGQQIALCDF